jgi:tripartite-type tricarboxylate transporter receptor subunit TctC
MTLRTHGAVKTCGAQLLMAAAVLSAVIWPQGATAQEWPARLITIIVPSAAGDGSDITARVFSDHLRQRLGQPVVIENRPGAGGVVGSSAAARAAPDGYTLVMGNAGSHGINAAVYKSLPYDIERDFTPISLIFQSPNIFVADPGSGIRSIGDLVGRMREKPGALDYASGGPGTSAHMNAEYLKLLAGGLQANHVPYRGATPALTDVMGGQVQFMAVNLPPAIGLVREGKVTPLAVTSAQRNPALPQVPTVAESGFPGYESQAWFGLLAPAGTPQPIVHRLGQEIAEICKIPEVRQRLEGLGGEAACLSAEQFRAIIAADIVTCSPETPPV